MKARRIKQLLQVSLAFTLAGLGACAGWTTGGPEELEARRKMELARALEASGALREATHEYAMIAEQYVDADIRPAAVRKAAHLSVHPQNPARSDSAALSWLQIFQGLPVSIEERENAAVLASVIKRLDSVEHLNAWQSATADSLFLVAKKQFVTIASQGKRIKDLETELEQSVSELKKLKEIDVRVSKSRRNR